MAAVDATRLLGAEPILVGIRPGLAQVSVGRGLDLSSLSMQADLESDVRYAAQRQDGLCVVLSVSNAAVPLPAHMNLRSPLWVGLGFAQYLAGERSRVALAQHDIFEQVAYWIAF